MSSKNKPTVTRICSSGPSTHTRPIRSEPRPISKLSKPSSSKYTSYPQSSCGTSVDIKLQNLKSSKEVIAHYQQMLKQLNKENTEMQDKVIDCMEVCNYSAELELELIARNAEISTLKHTLSDVQTSLYQERGQCLSLVSENDKLRMREAEDRVKIDYLLTLCHRPTSEDELQIFVARHANALCVPQIVPPRLQRFKNKLRNASSKCSCKDGTVPHDCGVPDSKDTLEAKMLLSQVEKQIQLARDYNQFLLTDRELAQKESLVERDKLESHIGSLLTRLKLAQDKLCNVTYELLSLQEDHRLQEAKWLEQRELMERALELYGKELGVVIPDHSLYTLSGSGVSSIKQSKSDLVSLQEKLSKQESLITLYRNQAFLLQKELNRVQVQEGNGKHALKERNQDLAKQVQHLRNKFNMLDKRRRLEGQGFVNDIKMLRTRVENMEKHVYKLGQKLIPQISEAREKEKQFLLEASNDILNKVTQLGKDLQLIKSKVQDFKASCTTCS